MGDADHATQRPLANGQARIDFQTEPARYRHWQLAIDGDVATLTMDVDEKAGLFEGYELKLNSYDLGVDIELADAIDRLRFEHPQARVVVLRSGKPRVFSAGANIRMLAGASHAHKVNFCKFTNETRNGIEDLSENSGLKSICAINGTAAGGGYELALATDHIMLVDDGSAAVSLPELPLLAVLPGTGGLTRVVRQAQSAPRPCRRVLHHRGRRQRQARGRVAAGRRRGAGFEIRRRGSPRAPGNWPPSLRATARRAASSSTPLTRTFAPDSVEYGAVAVEFARAERIATVTLRGPAAPPPASADAMAGARRRFLAARHSRASSTTPSCISGSTNSTSRRSCSSRPATRPRCWPTTASSTPIKEHWLAREIRLLWKRVLKRVDLTSRSLVTLIEPGSCFAGTLAELPFASPTAPTCWSGCATATTSRRRRSR